MSAPGVYNTKPDSTLGSMERLGDLIDFAQLAATNSKLGQKAISREMLSFGYRSGLLLSVEHFRNNEKKYYSYAKGAYSAESLGISDMSMQIAMEGIISSIKDKFKSVWNRLFGNAKANVEDINDKAGEEETKLKKLNQAAKNIDDEELEKPKKVISYKQLAIFIGGAVILAGLVIYMIKNWKGIASGDSKVFGYIKTACSKIPFMGGKDKNIADLKEAASQDKLKRLASGLSKQLENKPNNRDLAARYARVASQIKPEAPAKLGWTKSTIGAILSKAGDLLKFLIKAPINMFNALKGWKNTAEAEASAKVAGKTEFGSMDDYLASRPAKEALSYSRENEYDDEGGKPSFRERMGFVFKGLSFIWSSIKACLWVVVKTTLVVGTILGISRYLASSSQK